MAARRVSGSSGDRESGQNLAEDTAVALHRFYWGHSLSLSTGLLQGEVPWLVGLWQLFPSQLHGVPGGQHETRSHQLTKDRRVHYQSEPREGSAFWLGTAQTACLHGALARRGTATHGRMDTGPWAGRAVPPEPATAPAANTETG